MTTDLLIERVCITGANGFIGRWLTAELTRHGVHVTALLRRPQTRVAELRQWVEAHRGVSRLVHVANFDLQRDDLGLGDDGAAALRDADAVFHLAARFDFGLSAEVARRANVDAATTLVRWVAAHSNLRRFVHFSGYRTESIAAAGLDVDDPVNLERYYRDHGAYEASKMEAHERVYREAKRLGVPLTRVSPAIVTGDSRTGETTQFVGLVDILRQLNAGGLPALPGNRNVWLPTIPVDTLAALVARIPGDTESEGAHVVALDHRTPTLAEMVRFAAARMGVAAPKRFIPVSILKALPSKLTGTHVEALSFVSDDRYDAHGFQQLCRRLGVEIPAFEAAFARWLDHLVDTRFGERSARGGRNTRVGGVRTFLRGSLTDSSVVLLHGLLLNEQSWAPVADRLAETALIPDLPGLGRSDDGGGTPADWMAGLLADLHTPPVVVGHSLGTAYALEYASRYPERASELVLVAPFFLQNRPRWMVRQAWLMRWLLRWGPSEALAAQLGGELDASRSDAVALLRHPNVARHSARWLRRVSVERERARYRGLLASIEVPTTMIVGSHDPLIVPPPSHVRVVTVEGAGHYPQLSHPDRVADVIARITKATSGHRAPFKAA